MQNTITAFGDSIMKGVVLKHNSCTGMPKYSILSDNFANQCQQQLQIRIDNHSKFGCTIRYGLEMVKKYRDEICQSDYAIFEYGGNDCDFRWNEVAEEPDIMHLPRTPFEEFRAMYREIIAYVKSLGTTPVLMSLPALDDVRFFKQISQNLNADNILRWLGGTTAHISNWHEMYNLEVFRLGRSAHVPVIDITSPFLMKNDFREYLCEDGMHPNEKGHQLIAETVREYISSAVSSGNLVWKAATV